MRWTLFAALAALILTAACASGPDPNHPPERGAVETTIPAIDVAAEGGVPWAKLGRYEGTHTLADRMAHYAVPAVSMAVVDDFALVWVGAYGVIEAGKGDSATTNTLFEAGSTTKGATALAALRLAMQGVVDLDRDVNHHLTSWQVPPSEFTDTEKLTIYRLLTHTAGICRPDGGFSFEEGTRPTTVQVLRGESPALNVPLEVEFVPGSRHQYSNFGYVLLQQVLEDAVGESFAVVMRKTVFEPAGMTSSLFDPTESDLDYAKPHTASGEPRDSHIHPSALAQGELRTTPTDLAKLAIEIMASYQGRSGKLIDEATAKRMLTVQSQVDPDQNMGFTREGLGMFLLETEAGLAFCHPGYNEPGATSLFLGIPETGQALVVMTNGARGLELSLEILSSVATAYAWPEIEPSLTK